MPPDHRLGLDEDEDLEPAGPEAAQREPKPPVGRGDVGRPSCGRREEAGQLLPERQVLEGEVRA